MKNTDWSAVAFCFALAILFFGMTKCARDTDIERHKTEQLEVQLKIEQERNK